MQDDLREAALMETDELARGLECGCELDVCGPDFGAAEIELDPRAVENAQHHALAEGGGDRRHATLWSVSSTRRTPGAFGTRCARGWRSFRCRCIRTR